MQNIEIAGTAAEARRSPAESTLAIHLAFASRMLSADGHDDLNQGQVSARLPGSATFLIKQAVVGFNEACPDDMIAAHVDPNLTVDRMAPPELPLHQAIYAERPDVNAIVHSHAPHTLVFGATDLELKPISHDGACFQNRVNRFTQTSQTVLEHAIGKDIAEALGDGIAVLLRNHGGVVVGKSLREAAILALVLERACRLQLLAEAARCEYHVSSASDVEGKQRFIFSRTSIKSYWDHSIRRVQQAWPETREWA